jgi:hypothetical protein
VRWALRRLDALLGLVELVILLGKAPRGVLVARRSAAFGAWLDNGL